METFALFFYIDMGSLAHKGILPCHRSISFKLIWPSKFYLLLMKMILNYSIKRHLKNSGKLNRNLFHRNKIGIAFKVLQVITSYLKVDYWRCEVHKTALFLCFCVFVFFCFFVFLFFFFGIYMLAKQIMQLGGIMWKLLPPTGGAINAFVLKLGT